MHHPLLPLTEFLNNSFFFLGVVSIQRRCPKNSRRPDFGNHLFKNLIHSPSKLASFKIINVELQEWFKPWWCYKRQHFLFLYWVKWNYLSCWPAILVMNSSAYKSARRYIAQLLILQPLVGVELKNLAHNLDLLRSWSKSSYQDLLIQVEQHSPMSIKWSKDMDVESWHL